MVCLLKFQYHSYLGTFIFGLYVMACKMHFWLTWLDSLCWGQIEVRAKYLDMILIHKVQECPYDLIWSPQSHKWGSTRPPNIFHVLLPHTVDPMALPVMYYLKQHTVLCISVENKPVLCTKWPKFTMLFYYIKTPAHSSPSHSSLPLTGTLKWGTVWTYILTSTGIMNEQR